jgi:hypothetical protein
MIKAFQTFTVFISIVGFVFGQNNENSIKMISEYSSKNSEIGDLFAFDKIDYYKITLIGSTLIGKDYYLIVKEIWNGEITKTDTLINSAKTKRIGKLQDDSLNIRVIAKKISKNKLKLIYLFPHLTMESIFDAIESDDYSLRVIGVNMKIEPNKPFYALAYILPYEKDGYKQYCAVENSDIEIENWGSEFGIKHYILFEMIFH